ncbi:MAG: MBL fold metallo-hydrolase [Geobacteraceae bacterium]|nr:MBL fold metallo-hydrolase [Geobacteraceae bacterium]
MRVCLLASGSKGNAILVEAGGSKILVDAGLSASEILRRLASIGVEGAELDAVLISHEHTDHTRGAGTLARKLKIPLLLSYPTCRAIHSSLRKVEVVEFESGYPFTFRELLIDPFPITHDACDPVGFLIDCSDGKIGIATDLGIATRLVKDKLGGSRVLVLESNHDEEMLLNGPYPWHLKQRIKSRHGHLSNSESAELLDELLHPGLEGLFLAHLSEVNNDPEVAHHVTATLLNGQNVCAPELIIGQQHQASKVFTV